MGAIGEFAKVGFRPLGDVAKEPEIAKQFPPVKQLAKIGEYGGWSGWWIIR